MSKLTQIDDSSAPDWNPGRPNQRFLTTQKLQMDRSGSNPRPLDKTAAIQPLSRHDVVSNCSNCRWHNSDSKLSCSLALSPHASCCQNHQPRGVGWTNGITLNAMTCNKDKKDLVVCVSLKRVAKPAGKVYLEQICPGYEVAMTT